MSKTTKKQKPKLKLKKQDVGFGFKQIKSKFKNIKSAKTTRNIIVTIIVLLIILSIIFAIIGVSIYLTIRYNVFKNLWNKITGKKEGWINPPYQETRPYTIPKVQRPNFSVDSHGARCMLSKKNCRVSEIKKLSNRFSDHQLNVEKSKRLKLRDRDKNHRPFYKPSNMLTYELLGISPQTKSDYMSSNIVAEDKLDPETHAARLSSIARKNNKKIKGIYKNNKDLMKCNTHSKHPMCNIFKAHFGGKPSMEQYPSKFTT